MLKNSENNLIFSKNVNMNKEFNKLIEVIYEKPESHYNLTKIMRNEILVYIIENDIKKPPTAKEDFKWSNAFKVNHNGIDPNQADLYYSKNIDEFKEIWRTHHEGYKQLLNNPRNDFHTNFKSTCLRFIKNDMKHQQGSKLGEAVFMANWSLINLAKKFKKVKEENKDYVNELDEMDKKTTELEEKIEKLEKENGISGAIETNNYVDKELYDSVCKKLHCSKELMKEKINSHREEVADLKEELDELKRQWVEMIDAQRKKKKIVYPALTELAEKNEE